MLLVISLALPVAIGSFAVFLIRGNRAFCGVECLVNICLGIGLGFGATSAGWFTWLILVGSPGLGFVITETASCAVLARCSLPAVGAEVLPRRLGPPRPHRQAAGCGSFSGPP